MIRVLLVLACSFQLGAATYYISPTGSDSANGQAQGAAWATFAHARTEMSAGDTLYLMDGTYSEPLCPLSGTEGSPVTYAALNDGQAVIDGQGTIAIRLGNDACTGWAAVSYSILTGIVAINGGTSVVSVSLDSDHNIFRRVSAYNAGIDSNSAVWWITGADNLIEDCVGGGSGRKMLLNFSSTITSPRRNIIRRFFSAWQEHQGADWDPGYWPWGDGIESYGGASTIFENSIAYAMAPGPTPGFGSNNQSGDTLANVAWYGNMAVRAGRKWDGTEMTWPCPSPYREPAPNCPDMEDFDWRAGFHVFSGTFSGLQLIDNLAWGNGGHGLQVGSTLTGTNTISRGTFTGNAIGTGESGVNAPADALAKFSSITDTYVGGNGSYQGSGAQLTYRYESSFDGSNVPVANLTSTPLWPWPMENRITSEFNTYLLPTWGAVNPELEDFSVTGTMQGIFNLLGPLNPNPAIPGTTGIRITNGRITKGRIQ